MPTPSTTISEENLKNYSFFDLGALENLCILIDALKDNRKEEQKTDPSLGHFNGFVCTSMDEFTALVLAMLNGKREIAIQCIIQVPYISHRKGILNIHTTSASCYLKDGKLSIAFVDTVFARADCCTVTQILHDALNKLAQIPNCECFIYGVPSQHPDYPRGCLLMSTHYMLQISKTPRKFHEALLNEGELPDLAAQVHRRHGVLEENRRYKLFFRLPATCYLVAHDTFNNTFAAIFTLIKNYSKELKPEEAQTLGNVMRSIEGIDKATLLPAYQEEFESLRTLYNQSRKTPSAETNTAATNKLGKIAEQWIKQAQKKAASLTLNEKETLYENRTGLNFIRKKNPKVVIDTSGIETTKDGITTITVTLGKAAQQVHHLLERLSYVCTNIKFSNDQAKWTIKGTKDQLKGLFPIPDDHLIRSILGSINSQTGVVNAGMYDPHHIECDPKTSPTGAIFVETYTEIVQGIVGTDVSDAALIQQQLNNMAADPRKEKI
tara:strand:- start:697 stop:2178 length:1482 start_codon:yes stop_codon:yes gene_type:complete